MQVLVKKISKDAKMPSYAHKGDAGMDLYSVEETVIASKEIKSIGTGIKIQLPEGMEAQIRPKSGIALNFGVTVLNSPGTIDAGYRGEIRVILINHGKKEFKIRKGQKIAQIVFKRIEYPELKEVEVLEDSARSESGFGSTGLE